MNKLLPWLVILAVLCVTGSIEVPDPYLPRPAGEGYTPAQCVCGAPPSLLPALYDRFPLLRQAPDFIKKSKNLVAGWAPDILLRIPAENGPLIDSIFVKTAPRFL